MDRYPLDVLEAGYVEPAVVGAGRDQHRRGGDRRAVIQVDEVVAIPAPEPRGLDGHADLGTELVGLDDGSLRQLRSRDPGGKAEVVLDPRA